MAVSHGTILVTGGAGFIGSHTVVSLVEAGWACTILDNFRNSCAAALPRIRSLLPEGCSGEDWLDLVQADLTDRDAVRRVFQRQLELRGRTFSAVIHFAGLKAVGESMSIPLQYYDTNLNGTAVLLDAMTESGCSSIVFSSSCTVYGSSPSPLTEDSTVGQGITNAYAFSKYAVERLLRFHVDAEIGKKKKPWRVAILRYFNPVGAHPSGRIGEDPEGPPNCLMPYAMQVLVGRRDRLTIFGDDYNTADGTCVRDYIHVCDVARGHIDALRWLMNDTLHHATEAVFEVFNFATGKGTSVKELVAEMERAAGRPCISIVGPRRKGDLEVCYCGGSAKAERLLGWRCKYGLADMCAHAWKWQSENPRGYRDDEQ